MANRVSMWWSFLSVGVRCTLWVALGLSVCTGGLSGRAAAASRVTRISLSQQFVVSGLPIETPLPIRPSHASDLMHLEPATAIVSCERIKEALLKELRARDGWKGKIYLRLHPRVTDADTVSIDVQPNPDGWTYYVDMPALISRKRFLNSVVQILLFEWANRGAKSAPAEMPPWLGEGFAGLLAARGVTDLLAEPFTRRVELQRWETATLELKRRFQQKPPLSVDQLSWPPRVNDEELSDHYRASAHLMVAELLRLDKGPQLFVDLLTALPQHLNWQTAFLKAFGRYFQHLVDLEKWWNVAVLHFLGRDETQRLTIQESLNQLKEVLAVPLDVQMHSNRIFNAGSASLQQVIREWDAVRLDPVIHRKLAQLEALQWRSTPPASSLVASYRAVLAEYLNQRNAAGGTSRSRNEILPNARIVQGKAIQALANLDQARAKLAAPLPEAGPTPSGSSVTNAPSQARRSP